MRDEKTPLTDDQVAALARPGESWEQARYRLQVEESNREWDENQRVKAEYYDLCDQIFRKLYVVGPVDQRAVAELRERLAAVERHALDRGIYDL
ncbi:hypothetical protein [Stutzerimonas stutzeri]|uniref:Uncharacterized protein n=1 Tax=Stutzerimonas stutzeri TaxID=316 RepID=A0AA40RTV8_STUST|nr:hypothetical protein [Stutzerimonas stutzeri]